MKRKIIQVASGDGVIVCLCDDGTVWELDGTDRWTRIKDIPQDREQPRPQPRPPPRQIPSYNR